MFPVFLSTSVISCSNIMLEESMMLVSFGLTTKVMAQDKNTLLIVMVKIERKY